MSVDDRVRWDQVFRQRLSQPYPDPDPLLLHYTPPLEQETTHYALDLAGGFGQNGLWLAAQGYLTDIIDISRVALNRARQEMAIRNIRYANLLQIDVDGLRLEANHYDVVCVFRYLKRDLFPLIKLAVKPGGRIIYESFNLHYLEIVPGFNPKFLLDMGELATFFSDWNILYEEEEKHNSRVIAVKPEI